MCVDFLIRKRRYKSIEILLSKGYPLFTLTSEYRQFISGFSEHIGTLNKQAKSATTGDKKKIESILDDAYIATCSNRVNSYYCKKDNILVIEPSITNCFNLANKIMKEME